MSVSDASNTGIGDGTAGGANTIAFSDRDGIAIAEGGDGIPNNTNGNFFPSNSIFSNGGKGIVVCGTNDPGNADEGPNRCQNFPVLTSATTSGGNTTIQGTLNSTPNSTFFVELFSNPSGTDEGKTLIGRTEVTTNANCDGSFTFAASQAVPAGEAITATATHDATTFDTSEFSAPVAVTNGGGGGGTAPEAKDDAFKAKKGKPLTVSAPGVLKNDSDPNGDSLTATAADAPTKGTLTLKSDGSFVYTPNKDFKKGTDLFSYRASDGKGGTDEATVTITVGK